MKYSEAKKAIEALSSKYSAYKDTDTEFFNVYYKNGEVAYVRTNERYSITVWFEKYFPKLPFSNKLYMILAELAMTPLDKRVEHKWNVIIGNDGSEYDYIICWIKSDSDFPYQLYSSDSSWLAFDDAIFTDSEFSALIKYIKTLPDGEWQAKVAEHGKTEVKGELK